MTDPTAPVWDDEPLEEDQENLWGQVSDAGGKEVQLSDLLQTQLSLAEKLQKKLLQPGAMASIPVRELKEMVTAVSTLLSLAHRTDQIAQEIATYRLYVSTVNEFLRRRSDSLGEDLAEELRKVAKEYGGEAVSVS